MSHPATLPLSGPLARFRAALDRPDLAAHLAGDTIGADAVVEGPFGPQPMLYADHVASGRALRVVESFVMETVLPYYANSHTEASYCGGIVTRLRREARAAIAACCGADDRYATIFCGNGATAGLNRLVRLLGADRPRSRVLIGPYEHHSNILPWRDSGAEVVEIPEAAEGGLDRAALARALAATGGWDRTICAFSAASNVTGILEDVAAVTRQAKAAGARVVWDYACGGPYLPIDMAPAPEAEIDAVVLSCHKFLGGPGASGLLILRRDAVVTDRPSWTGGGTVRFVSPQGHDYAGALEAREEAGTPDVLGDIRAALAFLVKDALGTAAMARAHAALSRRAIAAWRVHPGIELLGNLDAPRLPILSFRLRRAGGGFVHQQLVTRLLSDRFGIQARGGCACAGPYVHRLLGIGAEESARLRAAILAGHEVEKPGFTRLNLSVTLSAAKVAHVIDSVLQLAKDASDHEAAYDLDESRAIFRPKAA